MRFIKQIIKLKYELGVILFYISTRLPSLGHDLFNTDVFKWKARTYNFSNGVFGLDFADTLQKYHPGVTLMWVGSVGVKINNLYFRLTTSELAPDNLVSTVFTLHFFQKLVLTFVLAVTFAFIFYGVRRIFDTKFALLSVLFLMLEPFYIALSRVFHLEGLLSTFMIASFVWMMVYLSNPSKKSLFVSAFFGALAVLTKTSAVFMLPFAGLVLFIESFRGKLVITAEGIFGFTRVFFGWVCVYLLSIFLLWPALWVVPVKVAQTVYGGVFEVGVDTPHDQFYFGVLVEDPGFFYYFVVLGLRSSVLVVLGLLVFLGLFLTKKARWHDLPVMEKKYIFYLLVFVSLFLLEITLPSKKLDRYMLPSLMGLSLLSTFGLNKLGGILGKFQVYFFSLCLFVLSCTAISLHPDYLSYYNPLFGGLKKGVTVLEPKWMIGQHEVANFFAKKISAGELVRFEPEDSIDRLKNYPEQLQDKPVVAFPEKYYIQVWPFMQEVGARAVIADIDGYARISNYFVYPVWDDPAVETNSTDFADLTQVGYIYLRGVKLYSVYERAR